MAFNFKSVFFLIAFLSLNIALPANAVIRIFSPNVEILNNTNYYLNLGSIVISSENRNIRPGKILKAIGEAIEAISSGKIAPRGGSLSLKLSASDFKVGDIFSLSASASCREGGPASERSFSVVVGKDPAGKIILLIDPQRYIDFGNGSVPVLNENAGEHPCNNGRRKNHRGKKDRW